MAGLIWAGIGKGIADAGATAANIGIREYERRDAARLRSDEREEARADRAELEQDRREWQAGQNEIYRRTAAQQTAGNKGTGGMKGVDPADLEPGGKLATAFAAELGMTVPEYERQYNAMKTGDMSAYATESKDIGKVLDDEYGEQTLTERVVPEGFQKEFQAKAKAIGALSMIYATAGEAKNIAEGRQIGLVTNAMEGAQAGGDVTKAAQLAAISKGHVPYAGDSNVTRNVLTGDTSTTAVGTATIGEKGALAKQAEAGATENAAQAKAADALANKYRAEIPKLQAEVIKINKEAGEVGKDKPTQERLGQIMNSAKDWLQLLEDSPKDENYKSDKAKAQKLLRDTTELIQAGVSARAAPAAEKPADKSEPAAKLNALPAGSTYLGMSKGKKVYSLPDGSRYVEK